MSPEAPHDGMPAEQSLTARLAKIRDLAQKKSGRKIPSQLIADALIKAGCTSLDAQAKALGLNRSTAWTIVRTKHKLGCLNDKTARNILANPHTPLSVRALIDAILHADSGAQG